MTLPRPWALLAATLILATVVFGVPADYAPPWHDALVAALLAASLVLAWFAGGRALVGADGPRRLQAAAALLLVAPFVLFALVPGVGPPRIQPPQDNERRFLLLAVDGVVLGVALYALKEALAAAGERLYAPLGAAAFGIAAPLYVVFGLIQELDYAAVMHGSSWAASVDGTRRELTPLDALSIASLFFAGTLAWIAIVAFAQALRRVGWLGRGAAVAIQAIGVLGVAFLFARGLDYPSPGAAFSHWYTIPGFVAGIPATPWIVLCVIGVLLLRRLDREQAQAALSPSRPGAARSATT